MNVLILGGTSFFGREIALSFLEAGHAVSTFSRIKNSPLTAIPHIEGNRSNKEDLLRANNLGPWDLVVDNIAFNEADVLLAMDVFKDTKHYLLTSTVSIYNFIPKESYHPPIKESDANFDYFPKEEDKTNSNWAYSRGKLEAERTLSKQTTVPWTIIRPPVVYGKNDVTGRGYWYLQRLLEGKNILLANEGINSFHLCHSVDLAKMYLLCAKNKNSIGRTYNVAMNEVLTLQNFLQISAEALGVKPLFENVSTEEFLEHGGPYARLNERIYDSSLAKKEMGFEHSPLPDFIRDTAIWFKQQSKA